MKKRTPGKRPWWAGEPGTMYPRWICAWLFLVQHHWLDHPPAFAPLPRRRDRWRRAWAWRVANGWLRYALRRHEWERVCAGCGRWMNPTANEAISWMIWREADGMDRYYHHRCYRYKQGAKRGK